MGLINRLFGKKKKTISDEELLEKELEGEYSALMDLIKMYGVRSEEVRQYILLNNEDELFEQNAAKIIYHIEKKYRGIDREELLKTDLIELITLARDYGYESEEVKQYILERPDQRFRELAATCLYLIKGD